jgi:hypothetical protein
VKDAKTFKVVLHIERRPDGGIRVWSDDVPGLVLSHRDPQRVLDDIKPALETILSEVMGCAVEAVRLERYHQPKPGLDRVAERRLAAPRANFAPLGRRKTLEYAASACQ